MGKRAAGQDLTQLANECCSAMALLLQEPVLDVVTVPAPKQALEARRDERKRQHLRADCQRLTLLLEKVMAELSGDEWYYFWGLHQMFDILPQTMEEI